MENKNEIKISETKNYEEAYNYTFNFCLDKIKSITIQGCEDKQEVINILKSIIDTPFLDLYDLCALFDKAFRKENTVKFGFAKANGEQRVITTLKELFTQVNVEKAKIIMLLCEGCSDKETNEIGSLLQQVLEPNCEIVLTRKLDDARTNEIRLSMIVVE